MTYINAAPDFCFGLAFRYCFTHCPAISPQLWVTLIDTGPENLLQTSIQEDTYHDQPTKKNSNSIPNTQRLICLSSKTVLCEVRIHPQSTLHRCNCDPITAKKTKRERYQDLCSFWPLTGWCHFRLEEKQLTQHILYTERYSHSPYDIDEYSLQEESRHRKKTTLIKAPKQLSSMALP